MAAVKRRSPLEMIEDTMRVVAALNTAMADADICVSVKERMRNLKQRAISEVEDAARVYVQQTGASVTRQRAMSFHQESIREMFARMNEYEPCPELDEYLHDMSRKIHAVLLRR